MCTMYQQTSQWTGYFWQIYFALFWHLFLDIFVSFCSTPHHTIPCLIQINLILQFFFYFDVSTYTGPHGGRVVFACRNSNYTNGEPIVRLFVLLIAAINLESENSNAENRIWCNRCCQSGVKKQHLMFWMLRRMNSCGVPFWMIQMYVCFMAGHMKFTQFYRVKSRRHQHFNFRFSIWCQISDRDSAMRTAPM